MYNVINFTRHALRLTIILKINEYFSHLIENNFIFDV